MKEVESLKDGLLLSLPVSLGDPVTGGPTAPSACVYRALCGPVSVQGAEDPETNKPKVTVNVVGRQTGDIIELQPTPPLGIVCVRGQDTLLWSVLHPPG